MFSAASSTSTSALPEAPSISRTDDGPPPTANHCRYCMGLPECLDPVLTRWCSDPRAAGDVRKQHESGATKRRVRLFGTFRSEGIVDSHDDGLAYLADVVGDVGPCWSPPRCRGDD
jgi:hypothetical protein